MGTPAHRGKRARQIEDRDSDVKRDTWAQFTYDFVDETEKLYGQHGTGISTTLSISSRRSSPSSITTTDERRDAVETPASSVCTDIMHKLDPRLHYERIFPSTALVDRISSHIVHFVHHFCWCWLESHRLFTLARLRIPWQGFGSRARQKRSGKGIIPRYIKDSQIPT